MWEKLKIMYENLLLLLKYGSLILGVCGAVFCYLDEKTNKKIQMSYDMVIRTRDERLKPLEEVVSDFIILSIKKIYSDLRNNPETVKRVEIEHIISYWEYLPDSYKNILLKRQYEYIYEWYLHNK